MIKVDEANISLRGEAPLVLAEFELLEFKLIHDLHNAGLDLDLQDIGNQFHDMVDRCVTAVKEYE